MLVSFSLLAILFLAYIIFKGLGLSVDAIYHLQAQPPCARYRVD